MERKKDKKIKLYWWKISQAAQNGKTTFGELFRDCLRFLSDNSPKIGLDELDWSSGVFKKKSRNDRYEYKRNFISYFSKE